jgi:hypothetical protein
MLLNRKCGRMSACSALIRAWASSTMLRRHVAHPERDDDGAHREGPEQESRVRIVDDDGMREDARELISDLGQ